MTVLSKKYPFNNSSPMINPGDMVRGGTNGDYALIPVGAEGDILTLKNGLPTWTKHSPIFKLPASHDVTAGTPLVIGPSGKATPFNKAVPTISFEDYTFSPVRGEHKSNTFAVDEVNNVMAVIGYAEESGGTGWSHRVISFSFYENGEMVTTLPTAFPSTTTGAASLVYDTTQQRWFIVMNVSGGYEATVVNFNKATRVVTLGTATTFIAGAGFRVISLTDTPSGIFCSYCNTTTGEIFANMTTIIPATNTYTTGTSVSVQNVAGDKLASSIWDATASRVVLITMGNSTGITGYVFAISVSALTIGTIGSPSIYINYVYPDNGSTVMYDASIGKCIIGYPEATWQVYSYAVLTITGNTITIGTPYSTATAASTAVAVSLGSGYLGVFFKPYNGYSTFMSLLKITGTSITLENSEMIFGDYTSQIAVTYAHMINGAIWMIHEWEPIFFRAVFYPKPDIIGIAQNTVSANSDVTIGMAGYKDIHQSGLTPGNKYYLNLDGSLTTTANRHYLGMALTATSLLVKG